jgi:plastocyanin
MTVGQDRNRHRIERVDADDATRNLNGTRKATVDLGPLAQAPALCGAVATPCAFNGTSIVSSGAPMGPTGPFYVKVTAPVGTYSFLCRIHPGMIGSLTVVSAGAHATTDTERSARVRAQIRADRQEGFAAEAAASRAGVFRNADGTRTWVLTAGTGTAHTAVLEMLPRNVNIRKGDRVAWRSPQINEPHTVTFPEDLGTEILPKCEGSGGTDSDGSAGCGGPPPTRGPDELELGGGNGVRLIANTSTISDSGWIQSHAMSTALHLPFDAARATWSVRFSKTAVPGTYRYMCQVHGDAMEGFIRIP